MSRFLLDLARGLLSVLLMRYISISVSNSNICAPRSEDYVSFPFFVSLVSDTTPGTWRVWVHRWMREKFPREAMWYGAKNQQIWIVPSTQPLPPVQIKHFSVASISSSLSVSMWRLTDEVAHCLLHINVIWTKIDMAKEAQEIFGQRFFFY